MRLKNQSSALGKWFNTCRIIDRPRPEEGEELFNHGEMESLYKKYEVLLDVMLLLYASEVLLGLIRLKARKYTAP